MPRVKRIEIESGPALQWGDEGQPFGYTPGDDDTIIAALAKAVNEGIEAEDEIEGDIETMVAEVLLAETEVEKATGDLAWDAEAAFCDLVCDVKEALPKSPLADCPSPYSVKDVALSADKALVCYYPQDSTSGEGGGMQTFVIPFKIVDGDPVLAAQADWVEVEVEQNYVEKAARLILKSKGDVVWDENDSYEAMRRSVECNLPEGIAGVNGYVYVSDVAVGGNAALVCVSEPGGPSHTFIVPLTPQENGEWVVSPKSNWTQVESRTEYVEKAGRVLSAKNLRAMKDGMAAMQAVIDAEESRTAAGEPTVKAESLEGMTGHADPEPEVEPEPEDGELEYIIKSASGEERYTLGPLYAPDRKDAHGEWVAGDTLQKAVWEYVRESAENGRRVMLQHGDKGEVSVGEWVECMTWPEEHVIKMSTVGGVERDVTMPAGTVYLGVVWDEDAWPLIKSGKLNGYSLGGRAVKIKEGSLETLKSMGDKIIKSRDLPEIVESITLAGK